jgi:hypothetical protein
MRWKIGGLARHDDAVYGEKYEALMAATGLSYQTIANTAMVAGKVELSRRRENLSFAHHTEVAALPAVEQDRLLDLAQKAGEPP